MKTTHCKKLCLAGLLLTGLLLCTGNALALEEPVAVVISKEIRPFLEMVQGFEQALDMPVVRIFLDKDNNLFSHDLNYKGQSLDKYACVVAVGPEALSCLAARPCTTTILYAMVLNPRKIVPQKESICGVSLNLFSGEAVTGISKVFPEVKKIGVFFNPDNNLVWFNTAMVLGKFSGIDIVPLHVRTYSDISSFFKKKSIDVDALLFIPDKTVSSPVLIKYVIKQAVAQKIPVIGYNRFFHKSGAALSFVLDYQGIGRQAAENVKAVMNNQKCRFTRPAHGMVLNKKVVDLLGIKIGTAFPDRLEVN
ncbi:MAG: ABC transporter substrate binding protein [Thermodesulfobacteriota bacterium]|nr:ABC transporter substrate binding protein [Thermodesulfobacteriota bacterium]